MKVFAITVWSIFLVLVLSIFKPWHPTYSTTLNITHASGSVPEGLPPITQESINTAVDIFNIDIPETCTSPSLDRSSENRGQTIYELVGTIYRVTIGPSAFTSWGILGSTLAHELEVHCRQNLAEISLKNWIGMDSIAQAEKEAYYYEVDNAERFGLTQEEVNSIINVYIFYYSTPNQ